MENKIGGVKKHNTNLIGLDLLRFLLSISVILFHYQHFYAPFNVAPKTFTSDQPFYSILFPLYIQGGLAVPIFWVISGFIFLNFIITISKAKQSLLENL